MTEILLLSRFVILLLLSFTPFWTAVKLFFIWVELIVVPLLKFWSREILLAYPPEANPKTANNNITINRPVLEFLFIMYPISPSVWVYLHIRI